MAADEWTESETGAVIVNTTDVARDDIMAALHKTPEFAQLERLTTTHLGPRRSHANMIERDRYVSPECIFDQFRVAMDAAQNDDVVSGIVESTEALAFTSCRIEGNDEDEQDIWNQIIEDFDLESRLRELWRNTFILNNVYFGVMWKRKTYTVRGKTKTGTKKKKKFANVLVPVGITILDPLKVVPVGNFMFGQERLAYIADRSESVMIDHQIDTINTTDLITTSLIEGPYPSSNDEKRLLREITRANVDHLYMMKQENVFRHTSTRSDYERFSPCRMTSVFELLDMKQQLREWDRTILTSATNYIVLVKSGEKDAKAKPQDLAHLAGQFSVSSRVPLIVGDHTLQIEIIAPKTDHTLEAARYNTIDSRITARLFQIMMGGGFTSGTKGDDSLKLARVISRNLEDRRASLVKTIQKSIINTIYEKNINLFSEKPFLKVNPHRIALDFDPNLATYMLDLRDRGDLSRDTALAQIDINQADEARKREREAEEYDDVFVMTNVPFSGDATTVPATPAAKKAAGRAGGGNTGGGGTNRSSPAGNTKAAGTAPDPNNPSGLPTTPAGTGIRKNAGL